MSKTSLGSAMFLGAKVPKEFEAEIENDPTFREWMLKWYAPLMREVKRKETRRDKKK